MTAKNEHIRGRYLLIAAIITAILGPIFVYITLRKPSATAPPERFVLIGKIIDPKNDKPIPTIKSVCIGSINCDDNVQEGDFIIQGIETISSEIVQIDITFTDGTLVEKEINSNRIEQIGAKLYLGTISVLKPQNLNNNDSVKDPVIPNKNRRTTISSPKKSKLQFHAPITREEEKVEDEWDRSGAFPNYISTSCPDKNFKRNDPIIAEFNLLDETKINDFYAIQVKVCEYKPDTILPTTRYEPRIEKKFTLIENWFKPVRGASKISFFPNGLPPGQFELIIGVVIEEKQNSYKYLYRECQLFIE